MQSQNIMCCALGLLNHHMNTCGLNCTLFLLLLGYVSSSSDAVSLNACFFSFFLQSGFRSDQLLRSSPPTEEARSETIKPLSEADPRAVRVLLNKDDC